MASSRVRSTTPVTASQYVAYASAFYREEKPTAFSGRWPAIKAREKSRLMSRADLESALPLVHEIVVKGAVDRQKTYSAFASVPEVIRKSVEKQLHQARRGQHPLEAALRRALDDLD